jgi:hypothetical protein
MYEESKSNMDTSRLSNLIDQHTKNASMVHMKNYQPIEVVFQDSRTISFCKQSSSIREFYHGDRTQSENQLIRA